MGHEAIIYGRIVGASWRVGEQFNRLQRGNREAIDQLPVTDEWPWLVRGMFALPADYPMGTYRRQIIHFGASIKDDPSDPDLWPTWLGKFEAFLARLYWWSAVAHLETEFGPARMFHWTPTEAAMSGLHADEPSPITEWVRAIRVLP